MGNMLRRGPWSGWSADADPENAPPGTLLRADNLTADERGALSLRLGSSTVYSGLADPNAATTVDGLFTTEINSTAMRFAQVGNTVFRNGVDQHGDFAGSGDIAFGTDSYQVFMARGETRLKYDGTPDNPSNKVVYQNLSKWGIPAPDAACTLTALDAKSNVIASFNNAGEVETLPEIDGSNFTVTEGTAASATGYDGTADGAMALTTTPASGRASLYKTWSSDANFFDIKGTDGSDTDIFDCYVALSHPERMDIVRFMFGLNTSAAGADPFVTDYYYFDFRLREGAVLDLKDPASQAIALLNKNANRIVRAVDPKDLTNVRTPAEVQEAIAKVGPAVGSQSANRSDAVHSSPAWTHFSVTRGQFKRVGNTAGRDWKTVRGFKVVIKAAPGAAYTATFDRAVIFGGGQRALTGKFQAIYRFARDTGNYVELSPPSNPSDTIILNGQGLSVNIASEVLAGADRQVNQIWIYLFGGFLDTYYRVAIASANSDPGMSIDRLDATADGTIDLNDRRRFIQFGLTVPGFTADSGMNIIVIKSEIDALLENEALEPGCVIPPENIVAIAGPVSGRTFVVTNDGWLYPSSQTSPSNFSVYHAIDLRKWGTPKWMKATGGGIHVGMTSDIIRIAGNGDESPDRVTVDFYPDPLGVGNPPVDACVFTDGSTIVYRAADGLVSLVGTRTVPVSTAGVALLWRNKTRHGVLPLDITTGRFRIAVDDQILYMIAPEGGNGQAVTSSKAVWRYDAGLGTWSRFTYRRALKSIFRDPDGSLIAGTADGYLLALETGDQDDANDIDINLWTPYDDNGEPMSMKTPHDIQFSCDSGGLPLTVESFLDGSNSPETLIVTPVSSVTDAFRADLSSLADFTRFQFRASGAFFRFILRGWNLFYRSHVQQVMAVDTGAILPPGNADSVIVREVEIDCWSPSNLTMTTYIDDVSKDSRTVTVTASKRSVYRVPLPRGIVGRRPRVKFQTTASAATGDIGFECYSVRVRLLSAGNETGLQWHQAFPAGQSS